MATVGIFGSHFAGDFFLGIDIMVTSMMVNFLLMCVTLIMIEKKNPVLSNQISVLQNRLVQIILGWTGVITLTIFLLIHTWKDLSSNPEFWYHHSTIIYTIVMLLGSIVFFVKFDMLKTKGVDTQKLFRSLPNE